MTNSNDRNVFLKSMYLFGLGHEASVMSISVLMIRPLLKISEKYSDVSTVYGMGGFFRKPSGNIETYVNGILSIDKKNTDSEIHALRIKALSNNTPRDFDIAIVNSGQTDIVHEFSAELDREYENTLSRLSQLGLINGYLEGREMFRGYDFRGEGSWDKKTIKRIMCDEQIDMSVQLKELFCNKNGCLVYQDKKDKELVHLHAKHGLPHFIEQLNDFENYLKEFLDIYKSFEKQHESFVIYSNLARHALKEIESIRQDFS